MSLDKRELIRILTKEGSERQSTWTNSTETLIEGFQEKIHKIQDEIKELQKQRHDNIYGRLDEFQDRLMHLKKLVDKTKKEKIHQLNTMNSITNSNLQK